MYQDEVFILFLSITAVIVFIYFKTSNKGLTVASYNQIKFNLPKVELTNHSTTLKNNFSRPHAIEMPFITDDYLEANVLIKSKTCINIVNNPKKEEIHETVLKEQSINNLNKNSTNPSSVTYSKAYNELLNLNCFPFFNKKINSNCIRLSKDLKGNWFHPKKASFTRGKDRVYLPLHNMPMLCEIIRKIETEHKSLEYTGGRVYLTPKSFHKSNA